MIKGIGDFLEELDGGIAPKKKRKPESEHRKKVSKSSEKAAPKAVKKNNKPKTSVKNKPAKISKNAAARVPKKDNPKIAGKSEPSKSIANNSAKNRKKTTAKMVLKNISSSSRTNSKQKIANLSNGITPKAGTKNAKKPLVKTIKKTKTPKPTSLLEKSLHLADKKVKKPKGRKLTRSEKQSAEFAQFLEKSLPNSEPSPEVLEVGEVIYIGDGICKVNGLTNARIDDVLRVETEKGDVLILVLGISNDLVETVVLGDYFAIKKGNIVISTQKTLKVPAGNGALGRIMSPIGEPLDGKGAIRSSKPMEVERPAPAVYMRTPIVDQLRTGFLVVDSIIPVGRGQRELVTGDRKTGKTRLMTDIICNLAKENIYCIYVSIGGQKAKVKALAEYLDQYGALKSTAIVMGSSDDPPSLNYLAPYAGTALAEYFADGGADALVIYDDLSKHAKAYRQMSLLLKRSPGRDAYPGDIFYLHSRLLERSSKVLEKYGGGSITALPMCETQNGDISEYITTNLMSITDGHIYLDSQMMHDGILPAVNSSSSVSRIGGSIQPKILRTLGAVAGSQLARYNEVKSYETMNTEITEETEREINRGKRILEVFNQPSGVNYTPAEESILLYLATSGLLDYIPLDFVSEMKVEIIKFYRDNLQKYEALTDYSNRRDADDKDMSLYDQFIVAYGANQSNPAQALKEAFDKKNAEKNAPPVSQEKKPEEPGESKK